ncbi:MAG: NADH/ubiquinone/plastoquinone (complex I), partial [Candidatus Omnitrophica bacterium]|nr:NADH/ubiquinone/plastoquinone (complex I) [Candidatus Omnitrophota bacterium]
ARSLDFSASRQLILYCIALFIMGFGLKVALVPFHGWLPDAHPAAPAPMSAMLSGVVIKTIGVYALVRVIFNIIGITPPVLSIMVWLGMVSMSVGVLLAIGQWDFKRLLAYHSVSQIGYVVFAIGLGTPLGIAGGLFHLFNHSLFKSLLFLNSGAVEYATGERQLNKLGALSDSMPVTANTSLVASLSISGIPPLCGFWSKLIIIIAAFQAHNIAGALVCILVGMVTLASFLKVQKYAFIRKIQKGAQAVKEAPFFMLFSMIVLALLCLAIGLFFSPFLRSVIDPAADVLLNGKEYAGSILGKF